MRTIRAVFRPGSRRVTTKTCLEQWDYGQQILIEGLELPNIFEVDFSLDQFKGISEPAIGTDYAVTIPDHLIETGETIYAFLFLHEDADDGETEYRISVPVEKRPARGTETPDPVEQSIITQTIAAIQTAELEASEYAGIALEAKDAIMNLGVDAETLEPESDATVEKRVDPETGEITFVFGVPEGRRGLQGLKGDTGAVYMPSVSDSGILSWTNNGGLVNPSSFDIVAAVIEALPMAEGGRF